MLHVPYQGQAPGERPARRLHQLHVLRGDHRGAAHSRRQVTPVAIAHTTRAPWFPEVQTTGEAGFPAIQVSSWYGLMGRAGTPAPVLAKITRDVREIMQGAEMKKRYDDIGAYAVGSSARGIRRLHQGRDRQVGRPGEESRNPAPVTGMAKIERIDVTYLNHADVQALALSDAEIVAAVEGGLLAQGRGETTIEPRMHLVPEKDYPGISTCLRGYIRPLGMAGVKIVGDYYRNYEVGLPSELAILNLFDPKNGAPIAMIAPLTLPTCAPAR